MIRAYIGNLAIEMDTVEDVATFLRGLRNATEEPRPERKGQPSYAQLRKQLSEAIHHHTSTEQAIRHLAAASRGILEILEAQEDDRPIVHFLDVVRRH